MNLKVVEVTGNKITYIRNFLKVMKQNKIVIYRCMSKVILKIHAMLNYKGFIQAVLP